ncbi:hypothetical protein VQ643_15140 [Pseudomonas sp. F1_0610]
MQARRLSCRPKPKLAHDAEFFEVVIVMLRDGYSPQQVAGSLPIMFEQ